jgi:predicted nucleic acid-binding protein
VRLVVAESSPLIVFARSQLLEILLQVVGEIIIPHTVFEECIVDMSKPGAKFIAKAHKTKLIIVHPDSKVAISPTILPMLDKGEIAALALALELGEPVLMDERLGRQAAAAKGIVVIGSAGILLVAKQKKLIAAVHPILLTWQGFGYFLSPTLMKNILQRAGE